MQAKIREEILNVSNLFNLNTLDSLYLLVIYKRNKYLFFININTLSPIPLYNFAIYRHTNLRNVSSRPPPIYVSISISVNQHVTRHWTVSRTKIPTWEIKYPRLTIDILERILYFIIKKKHKLLNTLITSCKW